MRSLAICASLGKNWADNFTARPNRKVDKMLRNKFLTALFIPLVIAFSGLFACSADNFNTGDLQGEWALDLDEIKTPGLSEADIEAIRKSRPGFRIDINANLIHFLQGGKVGETATMSFLSSKENTFIYEVQQKKTEFTLLGKDRLRITVSGGSPMELNRKK